MDVEIIVKFLLAILWGGIIGSERQYRSKSAGFRTMIMISLGACFFTILSEYIGGVGNGDRIASNIVSGIGFLGAGVIFKDDAHVNGITTAATIWLVAAVGMGIGTGYYVASAYCSIIVFVVLAILPFIERIIDNMNQSKIYAISTEYNDGIQAEIEDIFRDHHVRFKLIEINKKKDQVSFEWELQAHKKNHEKIAKRLLQSEHIAALKC